MSRIGVDDNGEMVIVPDSGNQQFRDLESGSYGKGGEIYTGSLYDTVKFATAQLRYKFFSIPVNQGTPAKTFADTNQLLAGVMPSSFKMIVSSIMVILKSNATMTDDHTQDLFDAMFNTTLEIKLAGKDNTGLFTLAELFGGSRLLTQTATYNNSQLSAVSRYPLGIPLTLAANTTFGVNLEHHVAVGTYAENIQLKFIFQGAVQRLS
jgi:hypothetical protein